MSRKGPNPGIFAILILPYGAAFGFVAFALPPIAVRHGIPDDVIARVVASTFIVHTLKFLWAPVVDTTLTRKLWYLIALALTAAGVVVSAAMPISPATLGALTFVLMASQAGLTLMGMACESFMALVVPEAEKGRAAGFYNAGNLGGVGVGAWAGLRLASALPEGWQVGAVIAAVMLLCAIPLLALPAPPPQLDHPRQLGAAMRQLGRDLAGLVTSRMGITGLVIAVTPVGTAALSNLWNAVAPRWGVVESFRWHVAGVSGNADDILGLVNGLVGGIACAVGALAGGWLADRMPRRLAYALSGGAMAVCSVVTSFLPFEPAIFVGFVLVYSVFSGISYAAFSAFVLETIGSGAVATKYNIFAGGANLAIAYTMYFDSLGLRSGGARGLLWTDAALTTAGMVVVILLYFALSRRVPQPAAAA